MYVTGIGLPFHLSLESILQGQRRKKQEGTAPVLGKQKHSQKSLSDVHVDIFIQNCIIWPTLNARESRMVSRQIGWPHSHMEQKLRFCQKRRKGKQMIVFATVAKLYKTYEWFKMNSCLPRANKVKFKTKWKIILKTQIPFFWSFLLSSYFYYDFPSNQG